MGSFDGSRVEVKFPKNPTATIWALPGPKGEIPRYELEQAIDQLVTEVTVWHDAVGDLHDQVETLRDEVAEDAQTAHDAAALSVLAAANAGRIMGTGTPEGSKDAPIGTIYVNTSTGDLFFKSTAEGTKTGWKRFSNPDDSWVKGRLTSTTNLDDLRGSSAVGLYPVSTTVGGSPTGTAGWVEITYDSNAARTKQRFTPSSPSEFVDLERVYQGSWRVWRPSSWFAGNISGTQNLNDYTAPGIYAVTSGSAANTPVNHIGPLEVMLGGSGLGNLVQRFTSTVNGLEYRRTMFAGGSFSSWSTTVDSTQVQALIDAALDEFSPPNQDSARRITFDYTETPTTGGSAQPCTWSWDRRVGYNSLSPTFRQTRDYGQTWEDVRSFSGMNVEWSKGLPNGEIMVETTSTVNGVSGVRRIWVSTGYDRLNPAAATWEVTLTAAAPLVKFAGWSIHISEEMILLNEYGPKSGMVWGSGSENIAEGQNARYTYRSFDNGKTWETIFDLNAWLLANGRPNADGQHLHGVAFDKYWDRIWITFGDAANSTNGVLFSDDEGDTWQAAQWTHTNPGAGFQVVGIAPMKDCILFAGDMTPSGCMRIDRSQGKHGGSYTFATAFEYDVNQKHLCHWIEHFENPSGETAMFAFSREGTASKSFILATRNGWDFDVIWESQGPDSPGIRTLAGPSKRGHLVAGVSTSSGWYEVRGQVDCY